MAVPWKAFPLADGPFFFTVQSLVLILRSLLGSRGNKSLTKGNTVPLSPLENRSWEDWHFTWSQGHCIPSDCIWDTYLGCLSRGPPTQAAKSATWISMQTIPLYTWGCFLYRGYLVCICFGAFETVPFTKVSLIEGHAYWGFTVLYLP